jgi:hypothetical protein
MAKLPTRTEIEFALLLVLILLGPVSAILALA